MRSFVLGLVATVALFAAPSPALAHASVESSDPQDGAALTALPETVSITLSEDVGSGAVLRVLSSSGTRLDDGDVTVTDVEDDPSQKWAPLWVMGFLVISSGLLIYIVKAGLTSSAKEDED